MNISYKTKGDGQKSIALARRAKNHEEVLVR